MDRVAKFDKNGNFIERTESLNVNTFTTDENTYYIRFSLLASSISPVDVTNAQLEEGLEPTEYEPYYNYDLAKIDNTKDYIYGSHKNWHIKKKTNLIIFNGFEVGWLKSMIYPGNFYIMWPDLNVAGRPQEPFFCNYLKSVNTVDDFSVGTCFSDNACNLRFTDGSINTLDAWKAKLKELYDAGKPICILYKRLNEIDIEINSTSTLSKQLDDIYYLKSSNGTTIIETESEEENAQMIVSASALKSWESEVVE